MTDSIGTYWYAASFDAARDQVLEMLRTYRVERQNLQQQKKLVQEALASLCSPRTTDPTLVRSRAQAGDDAMIRDLGRIAAERAQLEQEQARIDTREIDLNRLLRGIGLLPTYEQRIVTGLYINGRSIGELGAMLQKSEDTIVRYRKCAIRRLVKMLYRYTDDTELQEEEQGT